MAGVLYRLGRLCANRALVVVAVWIGLVLGVQLVVRFAGAETSNDLRLPGTESQQNGSSPFVFHVARGEITDTANKQAVESAYQALAKAPHVASAPDPFANAASGLVSKDATTAFTPVLLDIPNGEVTEELADDLLDTTAHDHRPALAVGGRHPPGSVARLRQRGRRGHGRAGRHHPPAVGAVTGRAAPVRGRAAGLPPPPGQAGSGQLLEPLGGHGTGHPLACGLVALALLAPLIVPMFSLHLGQEDVGATPRTTTERQAFDLLAAKYGPGYNGPW